MSTKANKYCLDANVLIQAWQKYYNPKFCPDYWKILTELGKNGKIFIPEMVYEEIIRTEDDLSKWLKRSNIPINRISEPITLHIRKILEDYPFLKKYQLENLKCQKCPVGYGIFTNNLTKTNQCILCP
jgi:rRNA-processing protein FCF1